jgi:hypothetical protein
MALRRERPKIIVTELVAHDLTLDSLFERLQCEEPESVIPVIVLTDSCDGMALAHVRSEPSQFFVNCGMSMRPWVKAFCDERTDGCV